jgi:hypothetical protein
MNAGGKRFMNGTSTGTNRVFVRGTQSIVSSIADGSRNFAAAKAEVDIASTIAQHLTGRGKNEAPARLSDFYETNMKTFSIGVDVGKQHDFTAIAVVEKTPIGSFQVRNVGRLPLDTSYTEVVMEIVSLVNMPTLQGRSQLIIDSTGVGLGIFDQLKHVGLQPIGITITGGKSVTQTGDIFRVPKCVLIGSLMKAINSGRLKMAFCMKYAPELVEELRKFRVRINKRTGRASYGALSGAHDDLVMAVAIAYFCAECNIALA